MSLNSFVSAHTYLQSDKAAKISLVLPNNNHIAEKWELLLDSLLNGKWSHKTTKRISNLIYMPVIKFRQVLS